MSALALIVAATLAQAGTLRSDLALRGGGAGRSVVSVIAWDKGGSQDWGAGIPSPTIDCAAVGTSSVAALQCSGANPSFAGPGQTAAGSPWWYRGDSAVRPAIALNGSTDWWDLGNQPTCGDRQTVLMAFTPTTISGAEYLFGIDDRSAKRDFALYRNAGALVPTWFKSGGYTEQTVTGIVAGSAFTFAASYDASGGDGAGVLRSNLNGTAPSPVTTGVAPLRNLTDQPMGIGASIGGAPLPSSSRIRRVARWCGWAGSAAELAQLVATQWGLAADKPSGTVATHTRTDSTPCGPFSDSELYWLGPGAPCIHAPTYSGWASGGTVAGGIEVYGPGANAFPVSAAPVCSVNTACDRATLEANSASCPMSPVAGTRMTLLTMNAAGAGVYSAPTGTMRSAWFATATGDPDCTVDFNEYAGTDAYSVSATATPVRWWRYKSTGTGFWIERGGTCSRVCFWEMQVTPTTYPAPPRSTTGTAYTGNAGTATTLTVPVAPVGVTDASGAVAVTFTAASPIYPNAILGVGSDWLLIASGATGARTFDGATEVPTFTTPDVTAGATLGVAWSGAIQSLFVQPGGVVGSHAYDGAFVAGWAKFSIGARADGTYTNPGLYRRFAQCKRASGCR